MHWNATGYDPSRPRRPLEIDLSYIWEETRQPAIEPREIEVKLRVGIDADLPEVAWIRMQRPFPVKPYGIIGSTALSTVVFALWQPRPEERPWRTAARRPPRLCRRL